MLAFLLASSPALAETTVPGSLGGQLDVDDSGGVTYSLPVAVPPGTAGQTPTLSLAYSSRAGNGLLGLGWQLAGISSVTRCARTLAQDGVRADVEWDDNKDRFCLDGQRLVVVSGAYGAEGSQYRTESESFSKIVYSAFGGSTRYFKVWTKNGQLLEFGATANSRQIAPHAANAVHAWMVTSAYDQINNRIAYAYSGPDSTGNLFPDTIAYGWGSNPSGPQNLIQFVYETRPTPASGGDGPLQSFGAGKTIQIDNRLKGIRTYANWTGSSGAIVSDYRLAYEDKSSGVFATKLSRLNSFRVCDSDQSSANCLPPVTFTWTDGGKGLDQVASVSDGALADASPQTAGNRIMLADVDGDGRQDMLVAPVTPGTGTKIFRANGAGFDAPQTVTNLDCRNGKETYLTSETAPPACLVLDMNLDGIPDLVTITYSGTGAGTTANIQLWLGTGAAPYFPANPNQSFSVANLQPALTGKRYLVGAFFNYDANADFVIRDNFTYSCWGEQHNGLWKFWWNGSSISWYRPSQAGWCYDWVAQHTSETQDEHYWVGDSDGNYHANIIVRTANGVFRDFSPWPRTPEGWVLNSDPQHQAVIANPYATGPSAGGSMPVFNDSYPVTYRQRYFPMDVNGDGRMDMVVRAADGKLYVLLESPTGSGPTRPGYVYTPQDPSTGSPLQTGFTDTVAALDRRWFVADVNGDGLQDLVFPEESGGNFYLRTWLSTGRGFTDAGTTTIDNLDNLDVKTNGQRWFALDVNGDGRADLVRRRSTGTLEVRLSNGKTFELQGQTYSVGAAADADVSTVGEKFFLADVSGDGRADLLIRTNGGLVVWSPGATGGTPAAQAREAIAKVEDGYGAATEVTYRPLTFTGKSWAALSSTEQATCGAPVAQSNLPDFYTPEAGVPTWPSVRMRSAVTVVAAVRAANGTGANQNRCMTYRYSAARGDAVAQSFAGFRTVTVRDVITGIEETRTLRQDGVYTGMVEKAENAYVADSGGATASILLTRNTNQYGSTNFMGAVFVYQTSVVEEAFEFSSATPTGPPTGCFLATRKTTAYSGVAAGGGTWSYDAYGNALVITATTEVFNPSASTDCGAPGYTPGSIADSVTTVADHTFSNDTTAWRLGKLTRLRVKTTTPGGAKRVKRSAFEYYNGADGGPAGFLKNEIIEPELQCTATLQDDYGTWCVAAEYADVYLSSIFCVEQICVDPGEGSIYCYCTATTRINTITLNGEAYSTKNKQVTTYTYDAFGNRASATLTGYNPNGSQMAGRTTTFGYDARGRFQTSVTNPLSHQSTVDYGAAGSAGDKFGKPASATDVNGLVVSFTYDSFGRKTGESRPDSTSSSVTRAFCTAGGAECETGEVYYTEATTTGAPAVRVYRDMFDRETRQVVMATFDPGGINPNRRSVTKHVVYDTKGQVTQSARAYFRTGTTNDTQYWTTATYDWVGRVKTQTTPSPDSATTTYVYEGRTSRVTDHLGRTNSVEKGVEGRPLRVVDALSGTTTFAYDPLGNLTSWVDAKGITSTAAYNIRGWRTAATESGSLGPRSWTYNSLGELVSQTDAEPHSASYTYDALSRVLTRTDSDGNTATYTYDTQTKGIGKPATVSMPQSGAIYSQSFTYDSIGRPGAVSETLDSTTYGFTRTYDSAGRLATLTYPNGVVLVYEYQAGQLWKITRQGGAVLWTASTRDASGRSVLAALGDGNSVAYGFDAATGRLTGIAAGPNANGAILDQTYLYDAIGNLTRRTDVSAGRQESFTYDALNRLTSAQVANVGGGSALAARAYTYDPVGNMLTKSDGLLGGGLQVQATYEYTAGTQQLVRVKNAGGTVIETYAYSGHGHTTSSSGSEPQMSRSFEWTAFNLPKKITRGSTYEQFWYNPGGQRFLQKDVVGGSLSQATYYATDGASGAAFEKRVPTVGNWRETIYVRAEGRLVALIHTTQGSGESLRYAHTDLLGSVHVITNSSGAVVERLAYDAWGKRRNGAPGTWTDDPAETITSETDRGYTTHEHLGTGLVHMNGRVYDPLIARFLSPDPYLQNALNTQDHGRFTYVNNNPFAYTDPSGYLKLGKILKSVFKVTAIGILTSGPVKRLIRNTPILQTAMRGLAAASAIFPPTAPFAPAIIAATNAYLTYVNKGSFGDILKTAAISFATSYALQGIGAEAGAIAKTAGPAAGFAVQLAGSAAVGCASSAVQGGSCGSAVISAGFVAFTGGIIQGTGLAGTPGGVFAEALAGGAGSVIGGGKFIDGFVNGFVTSAARYAALSQETARTHGGDEPRIIDSRIDSSEETIEAALAAGKDGDYNINLLEHEVAGGHTIKLHVAKSLVFLRNRLSSEQLDFASSFFSLKHATSLINMALNHHATDLGDFMSLPGPGKVYIETTFNRPTGQSVAGGVRGHTTVNSVGVVIVKPGATREGFLLKSAFPTAP